MQQKKLKFTIFLFEKLQFRFGSDWKYSKPIVSNSSKKDFFWKILIESI